MTKYTPAALTVCGTSLWGDTPWHGHVKMADIKQHSPMNGMDARHLAEEMAHRYNSHNELLTALEECLNCTDMSLDDLDETTREAIFAARKALWGVAIHNVTGSRQP